MTRANRRFCNKNCKARWHRRNEIRGAKIVPRLIKWRQGYGRRGGLGEITAIVDDWITDDKERGKT